MMARGEGRGARGVKARSRVAKANEMCAILDFSYGADASAGYVLGKVRSVGMLCWKVKGDVNRSSIRGSYEKKNLEKLRKITG